MDIGEKTILLSNRLVLELQAVMWDFKMLESKISHKFSCFRSFAKRVLRQIFSKFEFLAHETEMTKNNTQLLKKDKEKQTHINIESMENPYEKLKKGIDEPTTGLPIFFMHYNNNDYLKYSLAQAKRSNPNSTIYLLGDDSNNCYEFVEHRNFSEFFQSAEEFSKIYRHYNTTPFHYALFDFQRWFILKEFLIGNRIEKCLYLDSDVMLYADLRDEEKKFEQYDFTLSSGKCGSTFFLNRVEALVEFCTFLSNIYTQKDRYHYEKMVSHFFIRRRNKLKGGACDMTALQLFAESNFGAIGEVSLIMDSSVYDPNINVSRPGFEMNDGIKKITWKNGVPYGHHVRTGKEVKFNCLHFQGGRAKSLMAQFYDRQGLKEFPRENSEEMP